MSGKRFQFSLRRLMAVVTVTALAGGVISWLSPQTRVDLANLVLVIALLFGMFITAVLAIAVVQFSLKLLWRLVAAVLILQKRPRH